MTLSLDDVSLLGKGLNRPECVLATARGDLFTADWRGGVAHLMPDGTQMLYTGSTADIPEGLRPNGIALEADGSFLLANLGSEIGGVWRLTRDGQVSPVLIEIDGRPVPPSNYVVRDHLGRLWLTISTTLVPRSLDYRRNAASGLIAVMDGKGARIVAEGLGFTNECQISPDQNWLYVNETYGRRLSRFRLHDDASLGPKETVHEFGRGEFPDGLAFDAEGNVWIAGVISNQLIRIESGTGRAEIVLSETDADHVAWVEKAYEESALGRPHMDKTPATKLKNLSSIAFGGPERKTLYCTESTSGSILRAQLDVAGLPIHRGQP